MTERLQPRGSRSGEARGPEGEPTILGFPVDTAEDEGDTDGWGGAAGFHASPSGPGLRVLRRADPVGAVALVLAGAAANTSLLLSWSPGEGPSGLSLVQWGVEALRSEPVVVQTAFWQPPVVVLSGGLLAVLGLLLLVPARAHRLIGVLALGVTLAAAAAVVVFTVVSSLVDDRLGPGMWCAVAVPVLGVLGSLKAMLTAPLVEVAPRSVVPGSPRRDVPA